jgi:hypothetical protein
MMNEFDYLRISIILIILFFLGLGIWYLKTTYKNSFKFLSDKSESKTEN